LINQRLKKKLKEWSRKVYTCPKNNNRDKTAGFRTLKSALKLMVSHKKETPTALLWVFFIITEPQEERDS